VDAQITRERKRLDTVTLRLIAEEPGSEVTASLERTQQDVSRLLDGLTAERAELAATNTDSLSDEGADTIEAFAADVRASMAHATPADRGRIYEMFSVRGTVYLDPSRTNGVRLGRKHHFRIEWTAAVELSHRESRLRNPVMQWIPPPALISSETSTSTHSTPCSS
jgi:hypothetical protein